MKKQPNHQYLKYASMGTQMLVTIALGIFLGIKLDKWLHLGFPVFTVALSLVSVVASIYIAVKDLLKKK
ncbi:MAG: AtpZ/AtpI family protein [Bacteroidota bacterium]|jgi:F0F1-type ATP synthase assembly protein I